MNADRVALQAALDYAAKIEGELRLVREANDALYEESSRLRQKLATVQRVASPPEQTAPSP